MPVSRVWYSLVVLFVVSAGGALFCRTLAGGGDQERLLQMAGEGVGALPTTIGSWRMSKSEPMDEAALSILKCRAHESRVYVDDQTGDSISLILLAGVAGPIVAHTPEACYSSTDFDIAEPARPEVIRETGNRVDTFGRVAFRSKSLAGHRQDLYYAWRKHDGTWESPASPRLALGGQPMLYKLQIATGGAANSLDNSYSAEVMRRFLNDLLPILDRILSTE